MDTDIEQHIHQCRVCHKASNKGTTPPQQPQTLPDTTRPNVRIHVDLYGPTKAPDGSNRYIMVTTDAFTKIVRLSDLPNKTAAAVSQALLDDWIFIYGVPASIHSDQGSEFASDMQKTLWDLLKIKHSTTTPYHPQCNGQVEVFNRVMSNYLRKMILQAEEATTEWQQYLGPLMFSHNTAVHKATMTSPFYAMLGYNPRAPLWPDNALLEEEEDTPAGTNHVLRHQQMQQLVRSQVVHNNQHHKDQYLHKNAVGPSHRSRTSPARRCGSEYKHCRDQTGN